jgi:hypothetical protein
MWVRMQSQKNYTMCTIWKLFNQNDSLISLNGWNKGRSWGGGSISRAAGPAAIDLSSCIVPFHKTGQGEVTAEWLHCLRATEKLNSSQPTTGSTDRIKNLLVAQLFVISTATYKTQGLLSWSQKPPNKNTTYVYIDRAGVSPYLHTALVILLTWLCLLHLVLSNRLSTSDLKKINK